MDIKLRDQAIYLRQLPEEEALEWLLNECSAESGDGIGRAFALIPRRSWTRKSQIRLAHTYLSCISHNGIERALTTFGSFMSIPVLLNILWTYVKNDERKIDFLNYYLPVLTKNILNEKDNDAIQKLRAKLQSGNLS